MSNINSFTQTVENLTRNTNIALASMQGMNDTVTTQDDTVTITVEGIDPVTGDPSLYTYSMPSYQYTLEELARVSNTVNTFVSRQCSPAPDGPLYLPGFCLHQVTVHGIDVFTMALPAGLFIDPHGSGIPDNAFMCFF